MRLFILLALAGCLLAYAVVTYRANCAVVPITTPTGRRYDIRKLPDECRYFGICATQVLFIAAGGDTGIQKKEADGLLPWLAIQGMGDKPKGAILYAVTPGWARILPLKAIRGYAYGWVEHRWQYLGTEQLPLPK